MKQYWCEKHWQLSHAQHKENRSTEKIKQKTIFKERNKRNVQRKGKESIISI